MSSESDFLPSSSCCKLRKRSSITEPFEEVSSSCTDATSSSEVIPTSTFGDKIFAKPRIISTPTIKTEINKVISLFGAFLTFFL